MIEVKVTNQPTYRFAVNFNDLYNEALQRNDEVGEKLRNFGSSVLLKAEIIKRRIMKKDCIELGWVMSGYPTNGMDFENLDNMATPPNRVIFMDASWETCKKRLKERTVDWCTGEPAAPGSNPRVLSHPVKTESNIDMEVLLTRGFTKETYSMCIQSIICHERFSFNVQR
ncbi:hypothetical protein evm_015517 [Chilo suppressalis]|nr:hypothetical protein evm_015517 [Chilo suppressalis]